MRLDFIVITWVAAAFFASGCAHVGSRCVRASNCGGGELTCNGNFPMYQSCRTDADCHTTDGTRAECGSVMMNGERRDHTCVHPGTCVPMRETLP